MVIDYKKPLDSHNDNTEEHCPRVVMIYKNINTNPDFAPDSFSFDKYLVKKEGSYYPVKQYQGYEFQYQPIYSQQN